ncbi:sigma-54 interaction domain-containing protein [Evansella halocellulosilytica]|uniref:sigma-54 interaction domain-containing protein n=1 Tax=Evansella halocellulosilytica TaxID=2011013 RepID=UPI000BB7055A|nr:sigma 54-interacting transcriptional regulator [Evansella halocellulosilytica]
MFASDENTKEMLEAILQSIDEGIHVINRDGITIYYNEIAADHDGLEKKDVIGKPLLEVFPSLSSSTSTMLKVVKTGKPIYNQPQTYRNIKGKLIDTINSTIPVIVNQEVLGAVEIAKDYSRIKELSKKLIDLQSEMNERKTKPQVVEQKQPHYTFSNILSSNEKMMSIIEKAKLAAKTTSPILVYGETGTGKELFVQSIHNASKRSLGPLISQNCAAIPPSLLESILFGTTKGSFTGAENKEGLFELAHGGTLFLDEIHTLPFDLQAKLLRVLEDGIIRRVGSTTTIQTNVRIITATNEPPQKLIHDETLRKDLYYRLNVVSISIPPLRERIEDLPELISFFMNEFHNYWPLQAKGFKT